MENLEQKCLEKLDKILSKFDLKIEAVYIESLNIWRYHLVNLVDNSLSENTYSEWLYSWSSISNILLHCNSIFKYLGSYLESEFNSYTYQRYLEAYNAIKHLENICCLEEFLIRCDLVGV